MLKKVQCLLVGHDYSRNRRIEKYTHRELHQIDDDEIAVQCDRCGSVEWIKCTIEADLLDQ